MPSILIIEDDDLLRETIASMLAKKGYTVRQARDGNQGLEVFRAAPADLVLTDLIMPNKEGIATITELRRAHPKLGIIAMSVDRSNDAPLYLKFAHALGATRILKKPFDLPTLFKAVEEVLAEGHVKPSP